MLFGCLALEDQRAFQGKSERLPSLNSKKPWKGSNLQLRKLAEKRRRRSINPQNTMG